MIGKQEAVKEWHFRSAKEIRAPMPAVRFEQRLIEAQMGRALSSGVKAERTALAGRSALSEQWDGGWDRPT